MWNVAKRKLKRIRRRRTSSVTRIVRNWWICKFLSSFHFYSPSFSFFHSLPLLSPFFSSQCLPPSAVKIQKKYQSLGHKVILVQVEKDRRGLGISLAGHKDRNRMAVFVCGLNPKGAAHKTGEISVGDEILEVNFSIFFSPFKMFPDLSLNFLPFEILFWNRSDI